MAGKKLNTKSELSKNDIKIVVIVLVFLLAIIIGAVEIMFLYSPKVEEAEALQQTLDSLQLKVTEAQKVPQQITMYRNRIEELEGRTSEDGEETPELRQEIDVPKILSIVENAASTSNMQLKSVMMDGNAAYIKGGIVLGNDGNTSGAVENTAFYKLGVALQVEAVSYEGLMQFLSYVEEAGYYVTTSSAD